MSDGSTETVQGVAPKPLPDWLQALYPFEPHWLTLPGGQRLHYLDVGSGPPLVCVHGNPSWSFLFRHLVEALRGDHRCIVPDHLGFGRSDKPAAGPYSFASHVEHLEQLLDHLGIERCTLLVHDWGGAIGLDWAVRHPERVSGLVISNTALIPAQRLDLRIRLARQPLLSTLLMRHLHVFGRGAVRMATARPLPAAVRRAYLWPHPQPAQRHGLEAFVRAIPWEAGHPNRARIEGIYHGLEALNGTPALLLWGERDWCFSPDYQAQWRAALPGAQWHSLPEAGHWLYEDAPGATVAAVASFVRATSRP